MQGSITDSGSRFKKSKYYTQNYAILQKIHGFFVILGESNVERLPANIYLLIVNNENIWKMRKI